MKRHRMKTTRKKKRMRHGTDFGVSRAIGLGVGIGASAYAMNQVGSMGSAFGALKV